MGWSDYGRAQKTQQIKLQANNLLNGGLKGLQVAIEQLPDLDESGGDERVGY